MVQEDVLPADRGKNASLRVPQGGRRAREERRKLEVGPVQVMELPDVAQSQGRLEGIDVPRVDLQVLSEDFPDSLGHLRVHGHAHDLAEAPLPHPPLDRLQEVLRLELLDGYLRVPGDAERKCLLHLRPGKREPRFAATTWSSQTKEAALSFSMPGGWTLRRRGSVAGSFTRAKRSWPVRVADHESEVQAHVGDVGKGPPDPRQEG